MKMLYNFYHLRIIKYFVFACLHRRARDEAHQRFTQIENNTAGWWEESHGELSLVLIMKALNNR